MIQISEMEVNIVRHCNNRCACCSHASPLAKPYFMSPETLERDLRCLKSILRVDVFDIDGGEPLLHPDLCKMMDLVRDSGICPKVTVITNGRLLDRVGETFWSKLDMLRISVYPNLPSANLKLAEQKASQYGFALTLHTNLKFFKQLHSGSPADAFQDCPWKKTCLHFFEGYFYLCPQSCFFPEVFPDLLPGVTPITDGLLLDGLTEEKLDAFINRLEPPQACRICKSYDFDRFSLWHQINSRSEWIRDSSY